MSIILFLFQFVKDLLKYASVIYILISNPFDFYTNNQKTAAIRKPDSHGHNHQTLISYILSQYSRQTHPAPLLSLPHQSESAPFTSTISSVRSRSPHPAAFHPDIPGSQYHRSVRRFQSLFAHTSHSSSSEAFSFTTWSFLSKIPIRFGIGIYSPFSTSYRLVRYGASPQVISNRLESKYFSSLAHLRTQYVLSALR